ncbi:hypothetical protein CF336_g8826 [Tilletia laevis]|uniref:Tyr recombinase domain-containing protein n=1 Tax=Tilletia caries TaxID=13290 RepID=A0A177T3B1_9BASI|nr:hypothetical protein CF336_g8826 [Tilletia laevis]KAE8182173.1 hypothetical protein CF335_g8716 [Tilletia laevis]KAE8182175.1 hypothetical protein CF328_g8595 [Tilletia controversa]KAE8239961.1 hypothetical protein A4X03_0g8631 [Tilletia caries]
MRSHLRGVAVDDSGLSVATVWLPWTKTTLINGMYKFILDAGGCLNPVFALRHHLRLSPVDPNLSSSTPLFAFREQAGSPLLALTKKDFLSTINSALAASGREARVGNSFRIGGATVHWRAGILIDSIQLMGGWKSDTVMQYLRNLDLGLAGAHALTAAYLGGP